MELAYLIHFCIINTDRKMIEKTHQTISYSPCIVGAIHDCSLSVWICTFWKNSLYQLNFNFFDDKSYADYLYRPNIQFPNIFFHYSAAKDNASISNYYSGTIITILNLLSQFPEIDLNFCWWNFSIFLKILLVFIFI